GYMRLEPADANRFFQLINRRYTRSSMIVTSNKRVSEWAELFGDEVQAVAILDRLATRCRDPHDQRPVLAATRPRRPPRRQPHRPHLQRLAGNPRAGLGTDLEDPERADGQRPNQQVRAIGNAELYPDDRAARTTRITQKYVRGPAAAASIAARAADQRIVICL